MPPVSKTALARMESGLSSRNATIAKLRADNKALEKSRRAEVREVKREMTVAQARDASLAMGGAALGGMLDGMDIGDIAITKDISLPASLGLGAALLFFGRRSGGTWMSALGRGMLYGGIYKVSHDVAKGTIDFGAALRNVTGKAAA